MMPAPPDIEILLRLGTLERRVPLVAIAAVLRIPPSTLRDALGRLLLDVDATVPAVEGEPTEGVDRFVSVVSIRERSERSFERIVSVEGGGAGEGAADGARGAAERLAAALDDAANLGALGELVARYPASILEEALRRTLAIPRERIRKTRGAYFTVVVRRLALGSPRHETRS